MASKRQIIETLPRPVLQKLTSSHELEVTDRRSKDALVDALMAARRVKAEAILATMSQADLQSLSAKLALPPGPKMKAKLLAHILDAKPAGAGGGSTKKKAASKTSRTRTTKKAAKKVAKKATKKAAKKTVRKAAKKAAKKAPRKKVAKATAKKRTRKKAATAAPTATPSVPDDIE